ncbi:MAG: FAD-dependent oxidoreductase [Sphingomicrobium sp.]
MGDEAPNARATGRNIPFSRIALLLLLGSAILVFFLAGGSELLTLEELQRRRDSLTSLVESRPLYAAMIFAAFYVAIVALSVPGAAVMTLAAGALFGFLPGLIIASLSATVGATLAMLASRFLVRDWVKSRFPSAVARIDDGVARDGDAYLLSLRLAPIFPFFLINLAMGVTAMRPARFAILSMLGSLPGAAAYTFAGTALAKVGSLSDVLSPTLVGALLVLALLPLLGKWAARRLIRRSGPRNFERPKQFDANLIVIGAGSAGLVASLVATELQGRVILIERGKMGGDCLNAGCVPSKSLIRAARAAREIKQAGRFGVNVGSPEIDFPAAMGRVREVIEAIAPNDSEERFRAMGVDVRRGSARFVDPWTVEIDGGERVTAPDIVVASGAEPAIPDIPGLADSGFVTSDSLWARLASMAAAPRHLVVLGGGPIGCELGQALAQLGSNVAIVSTADRLLEREDSDASALIGHALQADGVALRCGRRAIRVHPTQVELDDGECLPFDLLLVATGRKAKIDELGLEELGVRAAAPLKRQARVPWPHIRFVGDAAGGLQFTHFAGHSGAIAAINALAGTLGRLQTDSLVPRVTYTSPEVASVGMTEQQAGKGAQDVEVARYELSELDRAIIDGSTAGFVKLVIKAGSDRVIGATIVAPNAGDLIMPWVLAIKQGIGLNEMHRAIYPYPTFSEASRAAAGEWRKAHKPQRLLSLLRRWNGWRRGS